MAGILAGQQRLILGLCSVSRTACARSEETELTGWALRGQSPRSPRMAAFGDGGDAALAKGSCAVTGGNAQLPPLAA